MDACPDSALGILDSIDASALSRPDRALYALLYSRALDKNYIDVADDSLILIAEDYYRTEGDSPRRLMLSYFYHGRVLLNRGAYAESLKMFTRSADLATQLCDDFWCGKSFEGISRVFSKTYHGQDEVIYARRAYESYVKAKAQPFVNYALFDIAGAECGIGNDSISLAYALQVRDSAYLYNDSSLLNVACRLIAKTRLFLQDYAGAKEVLLTLDSCDPLSVDLLSQLGQAYIGLGEMNKARDIYEQGVLADSTLGFLSFCYDYAMETGDYASAARYIDRVKTMNDSTLCVALNINFSQALADMYAHDKRITDLELKNTRMSRLLIFLVLIIGIAVFGIWAYRIIKVQRREVARNVALAQNLKEILVLKDTEISGAKGELSKSREKIRELCTARFGHVDSLCKITYQNQAAVNLKKKISDEVAKLIEELSSSEKLEELEVLINESCEGLVDSLRTDLPSLKEVDCHLFIYLVFGFSIPAITLFLKEDDITAVYNRKARLKNKIKKLEEQKSARYLQYMG